MSTVFRMTSAASVMCANLVRLEADLKKLEAAHCEELHFDIMDGVFVPNFTFGFDVIKAVRACCNIPCYAHLMILNPERYIERFVEAGCAGVTVHVEACTHAHRVLGQIRQAGAVPGIAINPATPLTKLEYLLDLVERILVMTVEPGYAGQTMLPGAFDRVRILKKNLEYRRSRARIEVDGNINVRNAALLSAVGAEIFVLGSAANVFQQDDLGAALEKFRADVGRERHLI